MDELSFLVNDLRIAKVDFLVLSRKYMMMYVYRESKTPGRCYGKLENYETKKDVRYSTVYFLYS